MIEADNVAILEQVGSIHRTFVETPIIQEVSAGMRGLIQMHSPTLLITVNDLPTAVLEALKLATRQVPSNTTLVQIPRSSFSHALWMTSVSPAALRCKNLFSVKVCKFSLDIVMKLRL